MSNAPKTVLCIHDLPGFGRAGLSVIVPVLSALGAQAVAVPTAVLSTHTGGLGTPAKLANPGYGPAALEHYRRLGLRFDCIYSGYLADASQAKLVEQAMDLWPDALTVVDPVMGDHGRMYRGLAPEMVPAMYTLCSRASLILPNTTEAALLLGDPMPGVTGEAELHTAQAQAQRLTRICPRVLITGVAAGRGIACVGAPAKVWCAPPWYPRASMARGIFSVRCWWGGCCRATYCPPLHRLPPCLWPTA